MTKHDRANAVPQKLLNKFLLMLLKSIFPNDKAWFGKCILLHSKGKKKRDIAGYSNK